MCCKPFNMLNDTCLIYLLLLLVEGQREELKMGTGVVVAAYAVVAAVVLVMKQITAKTV